MKAAALAATVSTMLDGAEGTLDRIGGAWTGGCGEDVVARLKATAEIEKSVRDVVLWDAAMAAPCSAALTTARAPEGVDLGRLRNSRRDVGLAAGASGFLVLAKQLPAGWGSVGVAPAAFLNAVDLLASGPGLSVAVVGPAGAWRAPPTGPARAAPPGASLPVRLLGALLGADGETGRASVPRQRLEVAVDASRDRLLAGWSASLPVVLVVGIAFGAGLAALSVYSGSPLEAVTRQLRGAIRRGELEVHYLPVVDGRDGRCVGAEALLRWRHGSQGLLRPDLFIALAEETGVILPMTSWLLRRVARDLPDGLEEPERFHVAVNLSGAHLRSRETVKEVLRAFDGSRLAPSQLVFEVTEREFLEDEGGVTRAVLEGLQAWGAKLALDDFGTGYANIDALRRFRLDYLKIDKSFVEGIGTGSVAATVVDAIVDLGLRLDLTLVAEGIERPEQLSYLLARGVTLFQGFLFSEPLDAAGLAEFVRSRSAVRERPGTGEAAANEG